MTYQDYIEQSSSEKITLATIDASRRLMGWVVHSGPVYKLENIDYSVITVVKNQDQSFTEVFAIGSVGVGQYYYDKTNKTIYLRDFGSGNPNDEFIFLTFRMFFSNVPVTAPYDLSTGFEVFWEPQIKSTSSFGVELDNQNQIGIAIEGSGQVTLYNDQSFWQPLFDTVFFENHKVYVYSWNRGLDIAEANLIFRGRIQTKQWSLNQITFKLKDILNELRNEFVLNTLDEIGGARIPNNMFKAYQRKIYGRVCGHRPINIDQVLEGYPVTGTISTTFGTPNITGVGTFFLDELSPEDTLIIGEEEYTISSITDNTNLILSENFNEASVSGGSILVNPTFQRKHMNRIWKVAGHALRQPTTIVLNVSSLSNITVSTTQDFRDGDEVFFGNVTTGVGEIAIIDKIMGDKFKLANTLLNSPAIGSTVTRLCVSDVRINTDKLLFWRDYKVDAANGQIELTTLAEFNTKKPRDVVGSVTFTSGSRTVTGTNTAFNTQLAPGNWIRPKGNFDYYEIMSIPDPFTIILRTPSNVNDVGDAQYKSSLPFSEDTDVLTVDVLGATENGLSSGTFLETAPAIVENILIEAGLSTEIDTASFDVSIDLSNESIGIVIPEKYNDTKTGTYRKTIDKINQNSFGSLIQNNDFKLEYHVLRPYKPYSMKRFRELDILNMSIEADIDRMVRTVFGRYERKEYDPFAKDYSFITYEKISDISKYILETSRIKELDTLFCDQIDAEYFSNRWAFILEQGSMVLKLKTKLQGIKLEINEPIFIEHEKIFDRVGGGQRKIAAVQSVKKTGSDVEIELEDLSGAYNRVCTICPNTTLSWSESSLEDRTFFGYITDAYGMIDNDNQGLNLIW